MCGITGWVDWKSGPQSTAEEANVLERMVKTLAPRGPDASGTWMSGPCALGHRRLSVIDPMNGAQPMLAAEGAYRYAIVYNGELYNANEIRKTLEQRGHVFMTRCDTEVLLRAYIEWKAACLEQLVGIYAFAVWDQEKQKLFLARDRLGVKPLFYAHRDHRLLFGSEPKAILAHPDIRAEVNAEGIAEIFAIGPARTPGHGIFQAMSELKPGYYAEFDPNGLRTYPYWQLEARPHRDDESTTIAEVRRLLLLITENQLVSDVPLGMLLSGGLDSSALTAIAKQTLPTNDPLHTFSVDYADNDKHFQASSFQPDADAPWIRRVSSYLNTHHHDIEFTTPELAEALKPVVLARDTPGMADIDSSLLLFAKKIKTQVTVALSGEGADEVFGGYPWYFREEMLHANTFPWSIAMNERMNLLSPELIDWIKPEAYVARRYEEAVNEVPLLEGEDEAKRRMRKLSYLNITRFMPTLLDRKDRMSMAGSLEVRVPFCDHRLIEYVWNIPWHVKTIGGREKGLLREALRGLLPDDVLFRKKSPYPKTYDPAYIEALKAAVTEIVEDASSPLRPFIDLKRTRTFIGYDAEQLRRPWFGQLMSGPQMLAYLIQVDYWLRTYKITVTS